MTRKEEIEQEVGRRNYPLPTMSIGFRQGVRWADKTMLDKVCKWLEEHLLLDDPKWYVEGEKTLQEKMINDLRKAMEEQK